ncbi:hypothetical protein K7432_005646 [Basidiobolus ranarum]|uniref:Uncharacterized protein n=1 Tax=Basidiobolus ranarum TaxID=34480 RepID=A0ABR2WW58_9FUNG
MDTKTQGKGHSKRQSLYRLSRTFGHLAPRPISIIKKILLYCIYIAVTVGMLLFGYFRKRIPLQEFIPLMVIYIIVPAIALVVVHLFESSKEHDWEVEGMFDAHGSKPSSPPTPLPQVLTFEHRTRTNSTNADMCTISLESDEEPITTAKTTPSKGKRKMKDNIARK